MIYKFFLVKSPLYFLLYIIWYLFIIFKIKYLFLLYIWLILKFIRYLFSLLIKNIIFKQILYNKYNKYNKSLI